MSRTLYRCDHCPELHFSRLEASMCCSVIQDAYDEDDDNPNLIRGED